MIEPQTIYPRCEQDQSVVHACVQGAVELPIGGSMPRVLSAGQPCPCGVGAGACHHEGCPDERCPWCGGRLVDCLACVCAVRRQLAVGPHTPEAA